MVVLPALTLGFVLGMTHAADADHVAAMSTLVSERRPLREAARSGALWGVGHALTILVVGGALVVTRATLPEPLVGSLELLVAAMLVGLGVVALLRTRNTRAHAHDHHPAHTPGHAERLRPVGVGLVHGLAGSAAVALAVLSEIEQAWVGLAYLVVFGLGTTAGMAAITLLMALPLRLAGARLSRGAAFLPALAGLVSVGAGVWLAHRVVVVEAVFSGLG